MFRGFIKWLSYYWVLPYPYVLLSVFLSAFVCSPVYALNEIQQYFLEHCERDENGNLKECDDISKLKVQRFNCGSARASMQYRIDEIKTYFQSLNCTNIKSNLMGVSPHYTKVEGSEPYSSYVAQVYAYPDSNIPGSCMTPYRAVGENVAFFEDSEECLILETTYECPANSEKWMGEFLFDRFCYCKPGFIEVPGRFMECLDKDDPWLDPCISPRQECITHCGSVENVSRNICYATSNLVIEVDPVCTCFVEPEEKDCNIVTGLGCSTYDKQNKSINAMKRIENAILNGSLNYTGVEGILLKSDGSYVDIKTLLTQISNANGITSAPAPSGIGQEQTKEAIKEAADNAFNFSLTRVDKADFSTELEQIQDDILDKKTEIGALLDEVKTTLFSSFSISASNVSKHLPCWRNINISGSNYFDICLADYEESLNYIPAFFIGFSFLMAAFIIIRPTNNEDDLWHD